MIQSNIDELELPLIYLSIYVSIYIYIYMCVCVCVCVSVCVYACMFVGGYRVIQKSKPCIISLY